MSLKSRELRQKRAALVEQLKDVSKQAEGRAWADDDNKKWDKIDGEINDLTTQIQREERLEQLQREAASKHFENKKQAGELDGNDGKKDKKEEHRSAFHRYVKRGLKGLSNQQYKTLEEYRAATDPQQTTDNQLGGYLIPEEYDAMLEKFMTFYGNMLSHVDIKTSSHGGAYKTPTVDDSSTKGAIISELEEDVVNNVNFGQFTLGAYVYTSRVIPISWELMQDAAINIVSEVMEIAGERLGRIANEHIIKGTGTNQPNGIMTQALLGKTAASATAVTRNELIDLLHSVDRAYRNNPNASWLFNDTTLAAIKKLAFGTGDDRPLWQVSVREGEPDRLEGKPYIVNNEMDDIATGNKPIAFGDMSKYRVRRVLGTNMVRLDELYALQRMTGFFAYNRWDGGLRVPKAIKYLQNA